MASTTPRQRVDADGFITVSRGRRKQTSAPVATPVPEHRRYRLVGQQGDTTFQAVKRLEQANSDLRVRITEKGGEIYLDPRDNVTAFALDRLCRDRPQGFTLTEVERSSKGVVLRYPLGYSLDPLKEHPCVTFVRRCKAHRTRSHRAHAAG